MTPTFDGIIDCLQDGSYHTFKELQSATGFTSGKLERILHFLHHFGLCNIRTPYFLSSHISRAKLTPALLAFLAGMDKDATLKKPVNPYPPLVTRVQLETWEESVLAVDAERERDLEE